MKVALVIAANKWFCPYIKIYEKILIDENIEYDIISWNRDGQESNLGFQFDNILDSGASRWKKFVCFIKYVKFVRQKISANNYDKLIIFGPKLSIFLNRFLLKKYRNRYIIDYRDLSIEQNHSYFYNTFKNVLKNASAVFVSSPGFIKYLPTGINYDISHNFDIDTVRTLLKKNEVPSFGQEFFDVLTIGGIRDYTENAELLTALGNHIDFKISFVGKGVASGKLEMLSNKLNINNVSFVGYYEKEDESKYIQKSSILNIYYPKVKTHSSALSNRFYNALIYKKPMIVTKNSIQGDYVEKYKLGIAITDCTNLSDKIKLYFAKTDANDFCEKCNSLLMQFDKDYELFHAKVIKFIRE